MFKNICWVQRLFIMMIVGLFIISVSIMLSGCGNKGDLYLPDNGSNNKGSIDNSSKSDVKTNSNTNPIKKKS